MTIAKKVKCPVCSNKRLMDLITAEKAELEIKCPKCGRIIYSASSRGLTSPPHKATGYHPNFVENA